MEQLNAIPTTQNEERFLNLLAAYSRAYEISQRFVNIQRSSALVITSAGVAAVVFKDYRPLTAGVTLVLLALDWSILERWAAHYRTIGASIQELFDCELFGLHQSSTKAIDKPEPEMVADLAQAYWKEHGGGAKNELRNWYPAPVGTVPLDLGRVLCQRASMHWDASLKQLFGARCANALWAIIILLVLVGWVLDWRIRELALAAIPFLAVARLLHREHSQHSASVAKTEKALTYLKAFWPDAAAGKLSKSRLRDHSRALQDYLYDRRVASLPIPNFYYQMHRSRFEQNMVDAASELAGQVDQAAVQALKS